MKLVSVLLFTLFATTISIGQSSENEQDAVKLSGIVVEEQEGEVIVLPYTNVAVEGSSRGTITEEDGFFSIPVMKGDTIAFSRIGYKKENYIIPDTLTSDSHYILQSLIRDTVQLTEAVIYPWPNKNNFKEEFLAMDVEDKEQSKADENLKYVTLAHLRNSLQLDSDEATSIMLQGNADNLHSLGQQKGVKLFDLKTLKKFFEKWRSGGFKKKDRDKKAFDIFVRDMETHGLLIEEDSEEENKN